MAKQKIKGRSSKSPYAFDLVPMPTGKKKGGFKAGFDLYPPNPLSNF